MNERFSMFIEYIKRKKFYFLALLVVVVGAGLFIYFRWFYDRSDHNQPVANESKQKAGSVVSFEGTVEIRPAGVDDFLPTTANQMLYVGDSIRTAKSSNIVLLLDLEVVVLDQESEVVIKTTDNSNDTIEQNYGKTYSSVEKKENQKYIVTKNGVEVIAIGTEFLIDIPKDSEVINGYAFKSSISFKHSKGGFDVAELNKTSLSLKTLEHTDSPMSDGEKELNKPYLALLGKSAQIIAAKKQAIKAKSGQAASSTGVASSTGSAASGSSGGSGGSSRDSSIQGRYSNDSIEDIVNALALIKDDALGDFTEPGGGGPPGGVYHYPPIDLDNLYTGVRGGRLYIKWTLGGTIPSSRQTIDDNIIESVTYNLKFSTEVDPNSSNNCGGTTAFMQINIQYHANGQIWYNPWFNAVCNNSGPYGTEDDWSFATTGNGLAHTYNSGIGKDSIVYSYSMADLGNFFNAGDTLKIDIYSEAESNNWGHYSFESNPPHWSNYVISGI